MLWETWKASVSEMWIRASTSCTRRKETSKDSRGNWTPEQIGRKGAALFKCGPVWLGVKLPFNLRSCLSPWYLLFLWPFLKAHTRTFVLSHTVETSYSRVYSNWSALKMRLHQAHLEGLDQPCLKDWCECLCTWEPLFWPDYHSLPLFFSSFVWFAVQL